MSTTSNLAFLDPDLRYDATSVALGFRRSISSFASVADTPNQRATAAAIEGLGTGTLYNAVLSQSAAVARQAFGAASGEIHASAVTAGFADTRTIHDAILTRMFDSHRAELQASPGVGPAAQSHAPAPVLPRFVLWGQGLGDFGANHGNGNAATLDRSMGGFVIGGDMRLEGAALSNWRIGVLGGYTNDTLTVSGRASTGPTRAPSVACTPPRPSVNLRSALARQPVEHRPKPIGR